MRIIIRGDIPGIRNCCYKVGIEVVKYFDNHNYSEYIKKR